MSCHNIIIRLSLLLSFLIIFLSCSHKEVREISKEIEVEAPVVITEPDYSEDMISIYKKLVSSIKKRDMETILECYSPDAKYSYSKTKFNELKCFNGEFEIGGIDNIESQYRNMFKKKYLDSIEYEIVNIDNSTKQLKIINLWANSDFGVYEYLNFNIIGDHILIESHNIVRERKGVRG